MGKIKGIGNYRFIYKNEIIKNVHKVYNEIIILYKNGLIDEESKNTCVTQYHDVINYYVNTVKRLRIGRYPWKMFPPNTSFIKEKFECYKNVNGALGGVYLDICDKLAYLNKHVNDLNENILYAMDTNAFD